MEREHDDDLTLIARVRSGETDAFARLWARHSEAAKRLAGSITQSSDADDLVSEAYLKIFALLRAGKGPNGPFRPYLFVTIRNIAVSWSRRPREKPLNEDTLEVPDPRPTDGAILAALDGRLTMEAYRSLPRRWQEVLWYTEVEGLLPQQIGLRLGMKANSVAALAYRAREGLRQAWIQAHVNGAEAGSEHQWALDHVGQATRRSLTPAHKDRFDAHVRNCPRCAFIASEATDTSSRFTTLALTVTIGAIGAPSLATLARPVSASATETDPETSNDPSRRRAVAIVAALATVTVVGAAAIVWGTAYVLSTSPESDSRVGVTTTTSPTPTPTGEAEPVDTGATPGPSIAPPAAPERPATPPPAADDPSLAPPSVPTRSADDAPPVAPAITRVDTGAGRLLPVVSGTARPGSSVTIRSGTASSTVTTNDDGTWTSPPLSVSSGTHATSANADGITATGPSYTVTGPTLSASLQSDAATVAVNGAATTTYQVTWDGDALADAVTDNSGTGITRFDVTTTGTHTIGAAAVVGDRTGPITTIPTLRAP